MNLRTSLLSSLALLACLSLLPTLAHAEAASEFGPHKVPLEATELNLGALHLLSLHDEDLVLPNDSKIFGLNVSPKKVAAVLHAKGMKTDRIPLSINILYAENDDHRYLFDTGMAPSSGGNILENLAAHHIEADSITDIFITHSHPDHIGGLLDAEGKSAFPSAVIHMAAKEWDFIKSDPKNAHFVEELEPQIATFDSAGEIAPFVTAFPLPGHTPGHSGYRLTSNDQSLTDIGDLVHSSVISLTKPEWAMGFDGDKDTGKATRASELAKLAKNHTQVFATHFPYPGLGTIITDGKAYAWKSKY